MSAEPSQPQAEKYDLEAIENKPGLNLQEYDEYLRLENDVFAGKRKKQLLRRMDLRVTLPIAFVYLVGYVDRTNIGNARLFGLEKVGASVEPVDLSAETCLPYYRISTSPLSNITMSSCPSFSPMPFLRSLRKYAHFLTSVYVKSKYVTSDSEQEDRPSVSSRAK
jgi:hypothetical protein